MNHGSILGIPLRLKRTFIWLAVAAAGLAAGAAWLFVIPFDTQAALLWLLISMGALSVLFFSVWRNLPKNRLAGQAEVLDRFGHGTLITVFRGGLLAGLIGFLALPELTSVWAWIPGFLFTTALVADLLDGYLARRQGMTTRLGEWLDINLDGAGVLIGCLVAIHTGRLPTWYLAVGLARYVFLAGMWYRTLRGKPVFQLKDSSRRRGMAGVQMVFIAVLLFPVFSPPGTYYAALVFMLVFLVSFAYDWLLVSGRLGRDGLRRPTRWQAGITAYFPLVLRAFAALLLSISAVRVLDQPGAVLVPAGLALIQFLLAGLILVGALGRLAALIVLLLIGVSQMISPLTPVQVLLIFCTSLVFFTGTGAGSLWAPEVRLTEIRPGRHHSHPTKT